MMDAFLKMVKAYLLLGNPHRWLPHRADLIPPEQAASTGEGESLGDPPQFWSHPLHPSAFYPLTISPDPSVYLSGGSPSPGSAVMWAMCLAPCSSSHGVM